MVIVKVRIRVVVLSSCLERGWRERYDRLEIDFGVRVGVLVLPRDKLERDQDRILRVGVFVLSRDKLERDGFRLVIGVGLGLGFLYCLGIG